MDGNPVIVEGYWTLGEFVGVSPEGAKELVHKAELAHFGSVAKLLEEKSPLFVSGVNCHPESTLFGPGPFLFLTDELSVVYHILNCADDRTLGTETVDLCRAALRKLADVEEWKKKIVEAWAEGTEPGHDASFRLLYFWLVDCKFTPARIGLTREQGGRILNLERSGKYQ